MKIIHHYHDWVPWSHTAWLHCQWAGAWTQPPRPRWRWHRRGRSGSSRHQSASAGPGCSGWTVMVWVPQALLLFDPREYNRMINKLCSTNNGNLHHPYQGWYSALLWQKEATLENDISCKWAKYVSHVNWHRCNIIMSWLTYLSAGWMFLLKIQTGSRTC